VEHVARRLPSSLVAFCELENMRMKQLLVAGKLWAFLLFFGVSNAALAETYYYYVGYMAQTAPYEYKHVFEKKIVAIQNPNNSTAANQLRDDYVAFIKRDHPGYFQAYISKVTDPKQIEFAIKAQAKIQGHYLKEKDARSAMEAEMKMRQERFASNPSNGPVVVTDEYTYKKW
jgi:hypothetical protein